MLLKDKVVVITGSTRGIGKGIALKVAEEGAKVVVSGIEEDILGSIGAEFANLGFEAFPVFCDVSKQEDVEHLMKMAVGKYGHINAICANAGITDMCKFEDMNPTRFDRMIQINLRGVYLTDYCAFPYLKETRGKIINIGSDCALEGWEYLSSYSAAKFGVRGLTQALAKEFGKYGINVNCICPGIIDTDMWEKTDHLLAELKGLEKGQAWANAVAKIPLNRGGKPEDVGNAAVLLLSKYADYITGCSLPVGGGSAVN